MKQGCIPYSGQAWFKLVDRQALGQTAGGHASSRGCGQWSPKKGFQEEVQADGMVAGGTGASRFLGGEPRWPGPRAALQHESPPASAGHFSGLPRNSPFLNLRRMVPGRAAHPRPAAGAWASWRRWAGRALGRAGPPRTVPAGGARGMPSGWDVREAERRARPGCRGEESAVRPALGARTFPGLGRDGGRRKPSWTRRTDGSRCRSSPAPWRRATGQARAPVWADCTVTQVCQAPGPCPMASPRRRKTPPRQPGNLSDQPERLHPAGEVGIRRSLSGL